jgi:hypothetical protein
MANHGIVRYIRFVFSTGGEWSPRMLAGVVDRPRYWTHEKLYRNISALLSEYAKKGEWQKVRRGRYKAKD